MSNNAIQEYFKADSFGTVSVELLTDTLTECESWKDDYGRTPLVSASVAQELAVHPDTEQNARKYFARLNMKYLSQSELPDALVQRVYRPLYFPDSFGDFKPHLSSRLFKALRVSLLRMQTAPTPQLVGTVAELSSALIVSGLHNDGLFIWPSFYRQNDNMMQIPFEQGRKLWDFTIESDGTTVRPGRYLMQNKIIKAKDRYHPPIFKLGLIGLLGAGQHTQIERAPEALAQALNNFVHRDPRSDTVTVQVPAPIRERFLSILEDYGTLDSQLVHLHPLYTIN